MLVCTTAHMQIIKFFIHITIRTMNYTISNLMQINFKLLLLFGQHIPIHEFITTVWYGRSLSLVKLFSAPHMTCLWPTLTHSPDCIATMSIRLGWWWRTGHKETIAYLSQADIANLSAIRLSLISAHGTAVSFLLPHGQIRNNTRLEDIG